jgi:superfamily II DNA or RNA helicase
MGHLKSYQSRQPEQMKQSDPNFAAPVVITRCGNVLTLSRADNMPFAMEFVTALTQDLKYQHVEQVHGAAQRNPITGQRQYFKTTEYKLYRHENGKIILLGGYLARVAAKLKKLGCSISLIDTSPERKRPECYTPQWDNLKGRIEFRPRQEECLQTIAKARCGIIKAVTGFGKAQPVTEPVYTNTGPVPIGTIQVGDNVIGANGYPTEVTGVYPQGIKEVVEVEFSDHTVVRCCKEHLWNVQTKAQKHRNAPYKTVQIADIADDLYDKQGNAKWFIPVTAPVHFQKRDLPVDSYLLGALLGDGGLTQNSIRFSSADREIVDRIDNLVQPFGLFVRHIAQYDWAITHGMKNHENKLKTALNDLGVCVLSKDKKIPDIYKHASFEQRLELLRGLMDTDGTVRKNQYHVEFGPVASKQLAEDVCDLVRSLGGVTRVKEQTYAAQPGKTYYRVAVNLPVNPFWLSRKAKLWRSKTKQGKTKAIIAVRPFGQLQCVCISVSADDGLYLTRDYTVTHNTTMIGALALLFPKAKIHVVTKSVDVAERIVKALRRFIPKVGFVGDGSKQWERVTVITAGSLAHSDGDADFLFCDEVHQLATINFSTSLAQRYRHSRNFGLSATPYARMDNAHAVLEPLFGPMIFELTYQQAVELGLVVPIRVTWLPIRMTFNPVERYSNRVAKKRYGVWTNIERNRIIANAVREYPETHQILILVETIEHAVNLGALLPDFTLVYGAMFPNDCAKYKAKKLLPADYKPLTDYDKHTLRNKFESGELKRVIATDVWATGVDFEQLNVLVRADDRDSDIVDVQGPGRVSRLYVAPDGTRKDFGEVLDCMDTFDTTFYRKSMGRRNSYKLLGWEQNWNDAQRSWRDA